MSTELFSREIYQRRRAALQTVLKTQFGSRGLILFPGNADAPMNYQDNIYPFRQDSSFLYFFGLNQPGRFGLVDLDEGIDHLFGDDPDLLSVVWSGPVPAIETLAERIGVARHGSVKHLVQLLHAAGEQQRPVHYLTPYRADTLLWLAEHLGQTPVAIRAGVSAALTDAVVHLREVKSAEEVAEIEHALTVTAEMHHAAMRASRPGVVEREIVGEMEGIMRRHDWQLAYPVIFSRNGEVLHNHSHDNVLQTGDLIVNDTGCSSARGYASDITRTIPVGGRFTGLQRDLYQAVHHAQQSAIAAIKPGVPFVDLHRLACGLLVEGLRDHGVFRGATEDIVDSGAYAVVFQCGLGHQLGLDVHDMEGLGEDRVGYGDEYRRSQLFGFRSLRLAKPLRAGMIVTVEPGYYFIRSQQEQWAAAGKFQQFICYDALTRLRDVRGIRIEDDVLVTETGARTLGPHIARSIEEVEHCMAS